MGFIKEFKDFAVKGNVIDMAVGIIIGAAFGKIVSSFVKDIVTPLIGQIVGGVDFTALKIQLSPDKVNEAGEVIKGAAVTYGNFLQSAFDFIIVAFAIFIAVKGINNMKKKEEEAPKAPPAPSKEEVLLGEIRDLLKK